MSGLTLIELLVAMTIGLVIAIAVGTVFLSSNSGARRQAQIGLLQQSVRTAFDYLARDARMIGHLGCYTGQPIAPVSTIIPSDITNNYALGVEGYEYRTGNAYTLTSNTPANSTTTGNWETNVAAAPGVNTLPLATIAGSLSGDGLTPGSDVLIIRTVSGGPVRLTADTAVGASTVAIEPLADGSVCSDNSTAKVSGFCPITSGVSGSYGLIASCSRAQTFSVNSIAGGNLTINGALVGSAGYPAATTEVFPMQTVAYYVKASSSGRTTSLYRRIFDGDHANGLEQELIEGVEMLQVRYGVDTTTPDADGVIDEYRDANAVADWSRVVAIRMGVLLRATEPLDPDMTASTAGIPVNGVTVTPPTTTRSFDRRVFTTTVAVRNRISYL